MEIVCEITKCTCIVSSAVAAFVIIILSHYGISAPHGSISSLETFALTSNLTVELHTVDYKLNHFCRDFQGQENFLRFFSVVGELSTAAVMIFMIEMSSKVSTAKFQ